MHPSSMPSPIALQVFAVFFKFHIINHLDLQTQLNHSILMHYKVFVQLNKISLDFTAFSLLAFDQIYHLDQ